MKLNIRNLGILLIILLTGFFNVNFVTAQTTGIDSIKVVGNHAPPYRIIENDSFSGIYFDIMKEIGKRVEVNIVFKEQPFKRALKLMEYGRADIMLGPNRKPEREVYMVYTGAMVGRAAKVFYVHPESPAIQQYDDLKGKRVLTHRGKIYFDKFDKDDMIEKVIVNSYDQAIKMIAKKRADVVIMPEKEGTDNCYRRKTDYFSDTCQ